MGRLTATFVKNAPPGKHEDGLGLRLAKRNGGSGQWVFRYGICTRRREMAICGSSDWPCTAFVPLGGRARTNPIGTIQIQWSVLRNGAGIFFAWF